MQSTEAKSTRKWVANASPIILLAKIGHQHLLHELSARLVIPEPVADEIITGPVDEPSRRWVMNEGADYVREIAAVNPNIVPWNLGGGESAVLSWADQDRSWTAVIDDLAARRCAASLRITVTGTMGVILAAKNAGAIPDVAVLLEKLISAGLRISPDVVKRALRLAKEL